MVDRIDMSTYPLRYRGLQRGLYLYYKWPRARREQFSYNPKTPKPTMGEYLRRVLLLGRVHVERPDFYPPLQMAPQ